MSRQERRKAEKLMQKPSKMLYCDVIKEQDGSYKTLQLFNTKSVKGQPIKQYKIERSTVSKDGSIISEAYSGSKLDVLIKSEVD